MRRATGSTVFVPVPTPVPPAGRIAGFASTDAGLTIQGVQILCSAVRDSTVEATLGGPFLAWTDGEWCHFRREDEAGGRFVADEVILTIDHQSVTDFVEGSPELGELFEPDPNNPMVPVGRADMSGGYWSHPNDRWYYLGLTPDPDTAGVLIVIFSHNAFTDAGMAQEPTPPEVLARWETFVGELTDTLMRLS